MKMLHKVETVLQTNFRQELTFTRKNHLNVCKMYYRCFYSGNFFIVCNFPVGVFGFKKLNTANLVMQNASRLTKESRRLLGASSDG